MLKEMREQFTVKLHRKQNESAFRINRQFGINNAILKLLQSDDIQSSTQLIRISGGTSEQTRKLIELGGIDYFYKLLSSSNAESVNDGVWGLANLCNDSLGLEQANRLELMGTIIGMVHQYSNHNELANKLWLLGVLCKQLTNESTSDQLLSIFIHYLHDNNHIVKEECLIGIYQLSKQQMIEHDIRIIQECYPQIGQSFGLDRYILKIVSILICDDDEIIQYLQQQGFDNHCKHYLQFESTKKSTIKILQYYCLYYTESIVNDTQLSLLIQQCLLQESVTNNAQILIFNILFHCSIELFHRMLDNYNIIYSLQQILSISDQPINAFLIIAQIKVYNAELVEPLYKYIIPFTQSKSVSLCRKALKLMN